MSAHAPLSPSAAHRWMNCPGSVALSADVPNTSSKYADEGTMLHDMIAQLIERRAKPKDVPSLHLFVDAPEREEYEDLMMQCLSVFWARFKPETDFALVEQRVTFPDAGRAVSDCWGTADVIIVGNGRIETIDWKFGRGVEVEAVDNEQLAIYLLAAAHEYEWMESFQTLYGTIFQPRIGPPKEWAITTFAERNKWVERIRSGINITRVSSLLSDGDWCRFCPAKSKCPKLGATAMTAARDEFNDIALDRFPAEKIAEAMDAIPRIEAWIKAIEAEAMRRLSEGQFVGGYKIVQGRQGNRTWRDENAAAALFKGDRDAWELPKLRSIAQLEKAGKSIPENLVTRAEGKPHVAPASDRRPAMLSAALEFTALESDLEDL